MKKMRKASNMEESMQEKTFKFSIDMGQGSIYLDFTRPKKNKNRIMDSKK